MEVDYDRRENNNDCHYYDVSFALVLMVVVMVVVVVSRSSTLEFLGPVTLQHCLTSVVAEEGDDTGVLNGGPIHVEAD